MSRCVCVWLLPGHGVYSYRRRLFLLQIVRGFFYEGEITCKKYYDCNRLVTIN